MAEILRQSFAASAKLARSHSYESSSRSGEDDVDNDAYLDEDPNAPRSRADLDVSPGPPVDEEFLVEHHPSRSVRFRSQPMEPRGPAGLQSSLSLNLNLEDEIAALEELPRQYRNTRPTLDRTNSSQHRVSTTSFASTGTTLDDDAIDAKSLRKAKRPKLGKGCSARIFRRYPRSYACCIGILLPMWILVGLSLGLGRFLGRLEFGPEIVGNDAALRHQLLNTMYEDALQTLLATLPETCYQLYQVNNSLASLEDAFATLVHNEQHLGGIFGVVPEDKNALNTTLEETTTSIQRGAATEDIAIDTIDGKHNYGMLHVINVTEFAVYLHECGRIANNYTAFLQERWLENFTDTVPAPQNDKHTLLAAPSRGDNGQRTLRFHWIRCIEHTTDPASFNRIFVPSTAQLNQTLPEEQKRVYAEEWNRQQQDLYDKYLEEYDTLGEGGNTSREGVIISQQQAQVLAFNQSIHEASGRDVCATNVPAAAWFWFGVMTTVGYGNQAPVSLGGRAMVMTLGFLSIILFGAILSTAGTVTSHLVMDVIHRIKFKALIKKWAMVVVYGILWFVWLWMLAYHFKTWNWFRLGDEIWWKDAYWYSYITTTTVGLGDYHIPSEVLFSGDLVAYSLSYLFGFVLLSAFLTELSELVAENTPDVGKELAKRLKYVGVSKFFLEGKRLSNIARKPSMKDLMTGMRTPNTQLEDIDNERTGGRGPSD